MTTSLWLHSQRSQSPRLDVDLDVDVAVVGAGFSGLGAAHTLGKLGLRVAVLEATTIAGGASGRNAGFMLAGPAMDYQSACALLGTDSTRQLWDFTLDNNRALVALIEEHEIDCGYLRRGSMSLAASEEEWEVLGDASECLIRDGVGVCKVESRDLPRPFNQLYRGGLYYAGNGELDPAAFLGSVASILPETVVVYESTPVLRLEPGTGWTLETERAKVTAGCVILAANAWTASLLPAAPITPTRGQVVSTTPLDRVVVPYPMYANHGFEYWRQTARGRLVVGGWRNMDVEGEVGTDDALHPDIQPVLEAFANRIAEGTVPIDHRWTGIMGFTPDRFPLVGPVSGHDHLYLAAGYSGHGVCMAFRCGSQVALQAIGRPAEIPAAFHPARFL